jgi:hypothetical protein
MNKKYLSLIMTFLTVLPLQALVFRNFVIFNTGFCFIYLLCFLILPVEIGAVAGMIIGLASGLFIDLFYHTLGIHAAAGVLFMFLRFFWLQVNAPRSGFELNTLPTIPNYGFAWSLGYSFPLIFVHSLTVFLVEAGGFLFIGTSLLKSLTTAVISLIFIVLSQYFFFKPTK